MERVRQIAFQLLNNLLALLGMVSKPASEEECATEDSQSPEQKPVWCLVANVVEERKYGEGDEVRRGTKHFKPGAKVHCFPVMWGDGYENIQVVARHRGSNQYVTMIVASKHLTNWRVQLVYSPEVVRRLEGRWDGSKKAKKTAEELAAWM